MLIKEYRIPMPMSVQQYRIAQLYMIQKKSREESQGKESGVEIIENKPYTDGPGGSGQHTQKIYHISKHIPGWLVSILPKDALIVEEEAWNAYPYTRTRYTCPFVEKFSIDIETRYYDDTGDQNNVFNLSASELRSRVVDNIDIVEEQTSDYKKEEDPKCYKSKKTGRGPLADDWLAKAKNTPTEMRDTVMCAYKICKVEFKYWGMQSKIEKFIHDVGLRKVMLRAHKQAWCWQDEWFGLTIDDIRKLERETQLALQKKFGAPVPEGENDIPIELAPSNELEATYQDNSTASEPEGISRASSGSSVYKSTGVSKRFNRSSFRRSSSSSMFSVRSKHANNKEGYLDAKLEGIRRYSTDVSSDDDEFYDATDEIQTVDPLHSLSQCKWGSSEDDLTASGADQNQTTAEADLQHVHDSSAPCKITVLFLVVHGGNPTENSNHALQSKQSDIQILQSTMDAVSSAHYKAASGHFAIRLVACPAACLDAFQLMQRLSPLGNDVGGAALPSSLVSLLAASSSRHNELIQSLTSICNSVYNSFLLSDEGRGFNGQVCIIGDATGSILAYDMLCRCPSNMHRQASFCSRRDSSLSVHEDDEWQISSSLPSSPSFRVSPPSNWDPHVQPRRGSASTLLFGPQAAAEPLYKGLSRNSLVPMPLHALHVRRLSDQGHFERSTSFGSNTSPVTPSPSTETRRMSQSTNVSSNEVTARLEFEASKFFVLGSSLAYVLAMRQLAGGSSEGQSPPPQPACQQMYNLFYAVDPSSGRIEPLLHSKFSKLPPVSVSNYHMFPLGDEQSLSIGDLLSSNTGAFTDYQGNSRRPSEWSISSGYLDSHSNSTLARTSSMHDQSPCDDDHVFGNAAAGDFQSPVAERWWGEKRIDYALFYPVGLSDFPSASLSHLFHASFWESSDLVSFILRQIFNREHVRVRLKDGSCEAHFTPALPREKWLKKRTQVKLRNITANHRARDEVAVESSPQVLTGKFMYGPLDMVTLNGEKVDVYIMTPPPASEWVHLGMQLTDHHGKITCEIPQAKKLGLGIFPVKMVVRGDHTFADSYLAVLPPLTDCVIFSIDGSFTASVSIMGSDPKVRPGAIDVVRLWQDLGYVIIYVTARPDMQKQRVVTWLAQHNFPHGLVWFSDGLSHDPLKQKTILLQKLKANNNLNYSAGYGSSKDIAVYSQLGLPPHRIYVVGKATKKQSNQCSWLNEGYSIHLNDLVSSNLSKASFNAQVLLRKGSFGLPGQMSSARSRSLSGKKRKTLKVDT